MADETETKEATEPAAPTTEPAASAAPATSAAPAPRDIVLPLRAECNFWEITNSPSGKVVFMLKQGGIDGKVIAWMAFEPTMIMRVVSALSRVASELNPQLPRISIGG